MSAPIFNRMTAKLFCSRMTVPATIVLDATNGAVIPTQIASDADGLMTIILSNGNVLGPVSFPGRRCH